MPQIADLRRATEAMGYSLCERLTVYPRYLARPQEFLAPEMMDHLTALANPDGLAARQNLS